MNPLLERGIGHFRRHGGLRAIRHGFVHYGLRPLVKTVLPWLPEADWVDRGVARFDFWSFHRRMPTRRRWFNDMFWHVRATEEIVDPLRVFVSDKEFVKLYVKAVAGDACNVPTIAVLRDMDAVRAFDYPRDCCIKPTHGSGQVILRRDGSAIDFDEIASWFGMNYYRDGRREQNYRQLRPKVIVEPLIFDLDSLADFKIFCWQGEPRLIQVDMDRHTNHTRKYFDVAWREQPFALAFPCYPGEIARPRNLDTMLDVAAKLSSRFSLVRIDLYTDGERCLVGEITNCQANALETFVPLEGEAVASRILFGPQPARPPVAVAGGVEGAAVVALLESDAAADAGATRPEPRHAPESGAERRHSERQSGR